MTVPMRDRPDPQGEPGSLPWLGISVRRTIREWAVVLPDCWIRRQVLAHIERREAA